MISPSKRKYLLLGDSLNRWLEFAVLLSANVISVTHYAEQIYLEEEPTVLEIYN
jgi:hypothetical protein